MHIWKSQKFNLPTWPSRGFLGPQHLVKNIPKEGRDLRNRSRDDARQPYSQYVFFGPGGACKKQYGPSRGPISVIVSSLAFDTCGVEYFYTVFNLFFMT
jgi:hypothetical protein